jgi:hypothetical protein
MFLIVLFVHQDCHTFGFANCEGDDHGKTIDLGGNV